MDSSPRVLILCTLSPHTRATRSDHSCFFMAKDPFTHLLVFKRVSQSGCPRDCVQLTPAPSRLAGSPSSVPPLPPCPHPGQQLGPQLLTSGTLETLHLTLGSLGHTCKWEAEGGEKGVTLRCLLYFGIGWRREARPATQIKEEGTETQMFPSKGIQSLRAISPASSSHSDTLWEMSGLSSGFFHPRHHGHTPML